VNKHSTDYESAPRVLSAYVWAFTLKVSHGPFSAQVLFSMTLLCGAEHHVGHRL
jgi:hypothetical protein